MSRQADIERRLDHLGNRVREYADGAVDTADDWLSRGRRAVGRFSRSDARKRIARRAEDLADEANYQYRRLRRHAGRHPVATAAIVAGTVGALFLLYRALRRDEE
ncbi:hypothetical protein [Dyella acidisoli]|uniref:DUF883 domain-containing protein n=1 Tax=Dyella acidisoli TaxID=1867834 RepID=A0ABQ5XLW1_9GAMM|nr:hypothetical protein [Dyella acidisoli]GLQ92690.1 hypothetical protein GCM10007901_16410 [Dyella acidisoli]